MHWIVFASRIAFLSFVLVVVLASDSNFADAADPALRSGGRKVQFSESWFDRTCFGQLTAAMTRRRCQELLDKRIELADETIGLTDDQRSDLLTAGQIDIHRYFVRYEAMKRQFHFGDVTPKEWQERVKEVYIESNPYVNQMVSGLNGESSLYQKTLSGAMDHESVAKVQQAYLEYAKTRYAMKIDQTLKQVLRNAVNREVVRPGAVVNPLERLERQANESSADTSSPAVKSVRDEVIDLLLTATVPPEFYGNSRNYINTVIRRLIDVESELEAILNEREIAMFQRLYQMQEPHQRLGIPQLRQRLDGPVNVIQVRP